MEDLKWPLKNGKTTNKKKSEGRIFQKRIWLACKMKTKNISEEI
jgi:hypothetical protein